MRYRVDQYRRGLRKRGMGERLSAAVERHPVTAAALVALALFVVSQFLLAPRFQTNDDVSMQSVADGTYWGEPSPHLVFTSVLIGKGLAGLYGAAPGVPWYVVYLCLGMVVASTALIAVGFAAPRFRLSVHLPMVLMVAAGGLLPLFVSLQFTVVALLLGGAGLLVHAGASGRPGASWVIPASAGVLVGASYLVRSRGLTGVLLFGLPLIAVALARVPWRRHLPFLVGFLVVAGAGFAADVTTYGGDQAWQDYFAYNRARGQVHDISGVKTIASDDPVLAEVGWSANDLELFRGFFIYDDEVYSQEALDRLARVEPERSIRGDAERFAEEAWPALAVLAVTSALALVLGNRSTRLLVVANGAWMGAALVGLLLFAKLPARVGMPPLVVGAFLAVLATANDALVVRNPPARSERNRDVVGANAPTLVAVPAVILSLVVVGATVAESSQRAERTTQAAEMVRDIAGVVGDGDLVMWAGAVPLQNLDPWTVRPLGELRPLPGGWLTGSPLLEERLAESGITDVYTAFASDPDVFLVGARRAPAIEQFLAEHRDLHGVLRPVARVGGYGGVTIYNGLATATIDDGSGTISYDSTVDEPRVITLDPAAADGAVNYFPVTDGPRIITGWASTADREEAAELLLVFQDGELVAVDQPFVRRPDLEDDGRATVKGLIGFRVDLRARDVEVPGRFRVFAVNGDRARELPFEPVEVAYD